MRSIADWIYLTFIFPSVRSKVASEINSKVLGSASRSSEKDVRDAVALLTPTHGLVNPIRIGGSRDGGYVAPLEMMKVDALFSPGVGGSSDFELDFARRGVRCFMADASVHGPASNHALFDFQPKYVGDPKRGDEWMSLEDWVKSRESDGPMHRLGLQIDIEGGEWEVFSQADKATLDRFDFIVAELHMLEDLCLKPSLNTMREVLGRLTRDFYVCFAHANNFEPMVRFGVLEFPRVIEVTLVRKSLTCIEKITEESWHKMQKLSKPCAPWTSDIPLGAVEPVF